MMAELEFEQKYLLDQRKADVIEAALRERSDLKIIPIRQFYNNSENRYRSAFDMTTRQEISTKEKKTKIKLDTSYSINYEDDPESIPLDEFDKKFEASKRRLVKIRYVVSGTPIGHKVMVDFFIRPGEKKLMDTVNNVYAVVAEVETVLNENTVSLYLDLALPIYLERFLLKKIDSRDASGKSFKSANMTEDKIPDIEKALAELYESA
jgi:hypothetical protein